MYEHVEEVYDGAAVGASQSASLSMVAAAVSWKNTSSDMLCQICCVRSIISQSACARQGVSRKSSTFSFGGT